MLDIKLLRPGRAIAYSLVFALLILWAPGCAPKIQPGTPSPPSPLPHTHDQSSFGEPKAQNIILLIGDGMGLAQISGGMYLNKNTTALEKFPVVGLQKTHASDNLVTDSAAGGTAMACGVKTFNGAVGVDAARRPRQSILEEAEKKGLATGMLSTSSIVHATPGSFIAHVADRRQYEAIALDFLKTPIDIFIGGGRAYFNRRSDERDLYAELRNMGYVVKDFLDKPIAQIEIDRDANFAYLTADKEPLPYLSGRDYLVPATHKILEFLTNRSEKGFFLMIEGSQIDWGGHANDALYVMSEFKEFNVVIDICFEYAKRMENTLVVVTADHETGGFSINPESTMEELKVSFTTGDHTAVMVPVFAFGPGSARFSGIYDNTAIFNKMRNAYGWK